MRTQALSGLRRESVSPGSIGARKFYEAAFGNHPYTHPVSGSIDDVTAVTPADMKAYVKRVFARNTLKLAVVGDIDPQTLGGLLDRTFGPLPAKAELTTVSPVTATAPGANDKPTMLTLDVPQTTIIFGGQGIPRNDPDFMAAYVVNHILGGGQMTSRLYREVREKRGLAYSASNSLTWMKNSSLMVGSTATRADRTDETVATLKSEIKRLADEGPSAAELEEAKSYLKGSQMLALDTSTKIANALVQYQVDNMGIDYIARRNSIVDAVTPEAAQRVAKRIWGQPLQFIVVGRATPTPAAAAN
jgi:zinc protease